MRTIFRSRVISHEPKGFPEKSNSEDELLHEGWSRSLRVITTNFRVQDMLAHGPLEAVTPMVRAHSLISNTATLWRWVLPLLKLLHFKLCSRSSAALKLKGFPDSFNVFRRYQRTSFMGCFLIHDPTTRSIFQELQPSQNEYSSERSSTAVFRNENCFQTTIYRISMKLYPHLWLYCYKHGL